MQSHNWLKTLELGSSSWIKTLELPNFRFCNYAIKQRWNIELTLAVKHLAAARKRSSAIASNACGIYLSSRIHLPAIHTR